MTQKEKNNLTENLKRLSEISSWFEDQEEIDVEEGLRRVKEAMGIIKTSKERLKEIENEFEEVKKEMDGDTVSEDEIETETKESELGEEGES